MKQLKLSHRETLYSKFFTYTVFTYVFFFLKWLPNWDCSGEIEITVEFLIEMDKLVQLIESPIFACELNHFML